MPLNESDIIHLYKCGGDVSFAGSAYKTLLGRTITSEELHYAVHILRNGLTRKGFLYWLCRSDEFQGDFTFDKTASYWLPCYIFKGFEKAARLLRLNHKRPLFLSDFKPISVNCPTGFIKCEAAIVTSRTEFCFEKEFSILSLGQISTEIEALETYINHHRWQIAGNLAAEFVTPECIENSRFTPSFDTDSVTHNYLFTSPEIIYSIFTKKQLQHLAARTKDYFIFSMPRLSFRDKDIAVVWDNCWTNTTLHRDGSRSRWLRTTSTCGHIRLINHSSSYQTVALSYNILSTSRGGAVIIRFNNTAEQYLMLPKDKCPVTVNICLNPGFNELSFIYTGPDCQFDDPHDQICCFAINNLTVTSPDRRITYITGNNSYLLSETELGSDFLSYFLPDSYIRSHLHQNGFFEVEALSFCSDFSMRRLATTRYDYAKEEQGGSCFFLYKETDCSPNPVSTSVTFYIAKRKANFNRYSNGQLLNNQGG